MGTRQAVVLVPGLLGFSRIGGFYYFADRCAAALRGALEGALGEAVPVIPVSTLPTRGLAERQQALLSALTSLLDNPAMGSVERVHLVGHSTGGLDAELLTETADIHGGAWSPAAERVRTRLASVTTIAAPLWGTTLADSGPAEFLTNPATHLAGFPALARAVADMFRRPLPEAPLAVEAIAGAAMDVPEAVKFFGEVLSHRELFSELSPDAITRLRAGRVRPRTIPLRSYVLAARDPASADAQDLPEPFFRDLYRLTRQSVSATARARAELNLPLLRSRADEAIRGAGEPPPDLTPEVSDGIVTSALQLLDPAHSEELAGLAVADHADVIGHYDRQDALVDGRPLNVGLFHSGSGFGDDAFFQLWGQIAAGLVLLARP